MTGRESGWAVALLQAILGWVHQRMVVPAFRFWDQAVLGTWEELVTSAIHHACQEAARFVNGASSWFVALFNRQHRRSMQTSWQYNPWHTWWSQQEQRPNTLNALLAAMYEPSPGWQQQQQQPQSIAPKAVRPTMAQAQQPQAQLQQVWQDDDGCQDFPAASQHGSSTTTSGSDWGASLAALVAGVRNATPPSPQPQPYLSKLQSGRVRGLDNWQPTRVDTMMANGAGKQHKDHSTTGAAAAGMDRQESMPPCVGLTEHQDRPLPWDGALPPGAYDPGQQHARASAGALRRTRSTSVSSSVAEQSSLNGRNRQPRSRLSSSGAGKASPRPVLFLQHSGMGVIDAAVARASRTTGLVEDARLAVGLRIADAFETARQALRWLGGISPPAATQAPSAAGSLQPAATQAIGSPGGGRAGVHAGSWGSPAAAAAAAQSWGQASAARRAAALSEANAAAQRSHGVVRQALQRTLSDAVQEQQQQQRGLNSRRSLGMHHSQHARGARAQAVGPFHGSASGPTSPVGHGGHGKKGPLHHRPHLAAVGAPMRRTSSFSTWEEAVAHRREVTAGEVITQAGYPLELHTAITQDGYILCMERIPRPGSRDVVFFMHGILDTSMSWVSAGVTGSQAFAAWDMGFDVWLGNSRCNAPRLHQDPKLPATSPAYWRFSVNELGEMDVAAQLQRIHETKCQELLPLGPGPAPTIHTPHTYSHHGGAQAPPQRQMRAWHTMQPAGPTDACPGGVAEQPHSCSKADRANCQPHSQADHGDNHGAQGAQPADVEGQSAGQGTSQGQPQRPARLTRAAASDGDLATITLHPQAPRAGSQPLEDQAGQQQGETSGAGAAADAADGATADAAEHQPALAVGEGSEGVSNSQEVDGAEGRLNGCEADDADDGSEEGAMHPSASAPAKLEHPGAARVPSIAGKMNKLAGAGPGHGIAAGQAASRPQQPHPSSNTVVAEQGQRHANPGVEAARHAAGASEVLGHPALRVCTSQQARQVAAAGAGVVAAAANAAVLRNVPVSSFRRATSSSHLHTLLAGAPAAPGAGSTGPGAHASAFSANISALSQAAAQQHQQVLMQLHGPGTSLGVQSLPGGPTLGAGPQPAARGPDGPMSRQTSGGGSMASASTPTAVTSPTTPHAAHAPSEPYRLRAVGHSMGGMSLLIYMVRAAVAGRASHVHRLILLTPAGFHTRLPNVAVPVSWLLPLGLWAFRCVTWPWWRRLPTWRPALPLYIPTTAVRALLFKLLADLRQLPSLAELLRLGIKLLLSDDASQWDRALQMPHYGAKAMPAVSMDAVLHLTQCARTHRFRMFDYGSVALNKQAYGSPTPPDVAADYWRLGDVPVDLVAGAHDGIIPPANIRKHYAEMKGAGLRVSYKEFEFGHLDFTFGVKDELKTYMLRLLRK